MTKNLKIAKAAIEAESQAVKDQLKHLDSNFERAVSLIKDCKGHVVIVGLGKSGLVGRKISATMSSIGIPSLFLHPAEGLHGDLGMIMKEDVIIMLSYSGETEEVKKIIPALIRMEISIIAMTGKPKALAWKDVNCIIDCSVEKEACPYNLAPTSSTTALIAMGDALALTVSSLKGFKKEHLAVLHPLGAIGKRLTMRVSDLMRKGKHNPVIKQNAIVEDALLVMTGTRIGAVSIVNDDGKIIGFFTDGDLRRHLHNDGNFLKKNISFVMTKSPKVITSEILAIEAAEILKKYNIDNIPVVNESKEPVGILDQGDLLAEGIS
ncbi:MAG: KpsF/GutQ family sugar-phosphate isomerase [Endomicrobium sp.]|jgi:arabinose-5-phosphate isomerase|nr:KpsF/GutQ family sugar-phosphate isomerase [Endomicrobium sp.]